MNINGWIRKTATVALLLLLLSASLLSGCSNKSDAKAEEYLNTTMYNPKYNGINEQDYTYMWWQGGVFTQQKRILVQTGHYGMALEPKTASITHLGSIGEQYSAREAAAQNDETVLGVSPILKTEYSIRLQGKEPDTIQNAIPYFVDGEIVQFKDQRMTTLRILDSGTFVQRADLMMYDYKKTPRTRARMEFSCTATGMQYTYQAKNSVGVDPVELTMTLQLDPSYIKGELLKNGRVLKVTDAKGRGYVFTVRQGSGILLSFDNGTVKISKPDVPQEPEVWAGFTFHVCPMNKVTNEAIEQILAQEQIEITTSMLAPHTKSTGEVTFNPLTGAYTLETPDSAMFKYFGSEESMNEYERMLVNFYNPTNVPVTVLVNFNKPYRKNSDYADSGMNPMLRDAVTGEPLGHPVMISRNPHKYDVNPEPLYNAMWANFYTYITVMPKQYMQMEYTCAYAQWGTVYTSSIAHLCLIGWGGNQSWIVSSIGAFGEAFCYDPDVFHDCSIGTDGHALTYLPNSYGTLQKYVWSPGSGGSDYFVYYDENNKLQRLVDVKVEYSKYCPNLGEMTFYARTADNKVKAEMTFSLGRTNDVTKVFQSFKYTFLEDVKYTRLSFYQCGADRYNNQFRACAWGDLSGKLGEFTMDITDKKQKLGYFDDQYTNMKVENQGFWSIQYQSGQQRPDGRYNGVARGMVVREYNATINGKESTVPEISFFKTGSAASTTTDLSMIAEIVAPKECNGIIKAGSVVSGTIEYYNFPQIKENYYGSSPIIQSIPSEYFSSWEIMQEYAQKGALKVNAAQGVVEKLYPLTIKSDIKNNVAARFTIMGGLGYVPVSITGVDSNKNWQLFKVINGAEEMVDQSVHGNDYWQCTYDPYTRTFTYTFNVEQNGEETEYLLRYVG